MTLPDWTRPPTVDAPGDLGPVLAGATLKSVDHDRAARETTLRFALPPDAGTPEAAFLVTGATHLLAFAYLPPATPLDESLGPEETVAAVGDWARLGLVTTLDPGTADTPLVVARASLHAAEGATTLLVEGYGEDPDRIVWWEVRASGASVEIDAPSNP